MIYSSETDLMNTGYFYEQNGKIIINDEKAFRKEVTKNLMDTIVLGDSDHIKSLSEWIAFNVAAELGVYPASIQELYEAIGMGQVSGFTVPAINLRTLTFDLARAVFKSAKKINSGAFIFEIAKSEIGYTFQRPTEYTATILLAAISENYIGPLFMLGDHFQINAVNFFQDKNQELGPLKDLIQESIDAGFYNIDIDSSTLVDLSNDSVDIQQKNNYEMCSFFTKYLREIQPENIEIAIGGEIGEVGGRNSSPNESISIL